MAALLERLRTALADRYRIDGEIGRGGMATVLLAQDLRHPRRVALKVLDPEIAAAIGPQRFFHEIALASKLQHPHILTLLDSGAADGLLYYVMPYVEGDSLRERLNHEPQLPIEEALRLTTEVARALEYAHRQGVVHRDIKPENILLSSGQATVADFGIARAVSAAGGTKLTETGIVLGTPQYMSPEQAAASKQLDARSDQYSLGCVLYEMLAGRPPFVGPAESLAYQHQTAAVPAIATIRPTVPAAVGQALSRALAKTPADRFESVTAFVEALGTGTKAPVAPAEHPRGWRRRVAIATMAAALIVLGIVMLRGPVQRLIGPGHAPSHGPRQWILVAEFEASPEDAETARAARGLVSAALDQSTIVTTVTRDHIREVLRAAGKPDTTQVTAELARELAYRGSVRAVVAGQIHRLGQGYALILRVLDVERDSLILAVDGVARSQDELIPTVERLARRLRTSLGERRGAIRATRPVSVVATPSFEAYRKLVKAGRQSASGNTPAALPLLREAIALDPDFAAAYRNLGTAYGSLAMHDSAAWAYEQAARRPERLSELGRLLTQIDLAALRRDFRGALAGCDAILADDSTQVLAWNRRMVSLGHLGRLEEALRSAEEAAVRNPFGPMSLLHNIWVYAVATGDLERARNLQLQLGGPSHNVRGMWLDEAAGNWSRAESLAAALEARPSTDARTQWHCLRTLAAASAARGQVVEATRFLDRARSLDPGRIRPTEGTRPGHLEDRAQMLLVWASGTGALPPPRATGSDTVAAIITRGLRSALAGDTVAAAGALAALRVRPPDELALHGACVPVLEAFVALRARRWENAVRILQPHARETNEWGPIVDAIGLPWPRWLMAESWEKLGRPDSAAAYFELALSPGVSFLFQESRMISSFAHRRLVILYSRMGRIPDAERHWKIFSEDFTHPDPGVAHLVDEARTALANARGMAGSMNR